MIVQTDPTPLVQHATESFQGALDDTLRYAMTIAPAFTGAYRDSLKANRRARTNKRGETKLTGAISSKKPYAGILERGGGPHAGWAHRGPHVQRANAPRPLQKAGEKFGAFLTTRLGSTPMRSFAILDVGSGMMREQGPHDLILSGLG